MIVLRWNTPYNGGMEKVLIVVAAVFEERGRFLIARRKQGKANGGFWEFPGGKLENGESEADALVREILEELNCVAVVGSFLAEGRALLPDGREIRLRAYRAFSDFPPEGGSRDDLSDHDALAWAEPVALGAYSFTPADLPIVELLRSSGGSRSPD
jgi:mutator protein MutT